jgi:hypothetical protein
MSTFPMISIALELTASLKMVLRRSKNVDTTVDAARLEARATKRLRPRVTISHQTA